MKNFTLFLVLIYFSGFSQLVTTNSQLATAVTNASAGSTIILANGIWNNTYININKTGTISNPITIKAQTAGQVFLEGNSRIKMGGFFIAVEGLVFRNPVNLVDNGSTIDPVIEFRNSSGNVCSNCKVTNIKIDSYNGTSAQWNDTFKWILLYGQNNEISYSSFLGKYGVGSIINDNRESTQANYTKIHHNYFADRIPVGAMNDLNDQDAIRIGNSATSLSDSFTEVYDNLFANWSGEVEIISNKSGKNKYYNNTFRNYQGTLTLRHGNNCEVFGNYFFANNNFFSGGIRVMGENHLIYNNYIEGVNSVKSDGSTTKTCGGINISNGRVNSALNGYYQVKNAVITNNTFVNCDYGIRVGTDVASDLTLAPQNITIANSIIFNASNKAINQITAPIGSSSYTGNIKQNGTWDITTGTNNNNSVSSGLLVNNSLFYRITSSSAAVSAGVGSYSFLNQDILNGTRPSSNFSAGAEEFGANGLKNPYQIADVGLSIGFLASDNTLQTSAFLNNKADWMVYPNPTADYLFVEGTKIATSIKILDLNGRILQEIKGNFITQKIDVRFLNKGMYVLKMDTTFYKFIKN
jgi:poly(beta-D-mannuronate) lyase